MNEAACPYEAAVVESARTGDWRDGLRAHVRGCAACTEAARVTEWLGAVARNLGRDRSTPDPTYIWLRAEIEKRAQAANEASWRRVVGTALPGFAVGLLGAAALLAILAEVFALGANLSRWLSIVFAETSLVDSTLLATTWLGLPLFLAASYLLVFRRPAR